MEKLILVIYVGVATIRTEDIDQFVERVASLILPSTFEGETIVIPVQDYNSRIECINPKYVHDEEIIIKHNKLMSELNEQLQHQSNQLKENNNE